MTAALLLKLAIMMSIVLIVVGLGLQSRWHDTLLLFRNPFLLARSVLAMNVVMPLVAAALVVAFDLSLTVKVAMVAISVSPVPPLLPNKERLADGDAAYAISLLMSIAVLSIVTVPLALSLFAWTFHRDADVEVGNAVKVVLVTVLAPLAAGVGLRKTFPDFAARAAGPVSKLGLGLLVVSSLPLVYLVWPAVQALIGDGTVMVLALMAAIGLAVGHLLGGPAAGTRTDLALCTSARHPGLALAIAVGFGVDKMSALAAILLYVGVALMVSIPYVVWRKRRVHSPKG
jgi:BASS family bile acid:Na+ symporter